MTVGNQKYKIIVFNEVKHLNSEIKPKIQILRLMSEFCHKFDKTSKTKGHQALEEQKPLAMDTSFIILRK